MTTTQESQPVHRIVVGIDGSLSSIAALNWAQRQALLAGSTLEAITTWEWPITPEAEMILSAGFDPKGNAQEILDRCWPLCA